MIYRWRFTTDDRRDNDTFLYNNGPVTSLDDENLLFRQSYTLVRRRHGGAVQRRPDRPAWPPGPTSARPAWAATQDYVTNLRDPAITDVAGGGRTFVTRPRTRSSSTCASSTWCTAPTSPSAARTRWSGYNVNSIVFQVPCKSDVAIDGDATANPVIGVWSTTTRPTLRNADGTRRPRLGTTPRCPGSVTR